MTAPVALVTGASSGIGRATARLLAAEGFTVFGASRTPHPDAQGYRALTLDVRSDTLVRAAVRSALDEAGRIDVLVNSAGALQAGAIEENSVADVQAQFDTNVFGMLRLIRAVLPVMRAQGGGRIVNVGSVFGIVAPPGVGIYAASKFAVEGLTEALRDEVRPFGIHVSVVEPAWVRTRLAGSFPADAIAEYAPRRASVDRYLAASVGAGMAPEAVARTILKIATAARPRLRYRIGPAGRFLVTMKRILPEPAFERVRRRAFQALR